MKGVNIFDFGIPGPTTLIVGLVHGNEIVGKEIIEYIQSKINSTKTLRGKFITLYANLEGFKKNQRYLDKDLNRAFDFSGSSSDYEFKRACEIRDFFSNIDIDHIFDFHSTPSDSDPMILCTSQLESIQLASKIPIQYVVQGIIDIVEGKSLIKYFQNKIKIGMAFECGSHNDIQTIFAGKQIADIVLDFHQGEILPKQKLQTKIQITDLIHTIDKNFLYTKNYKGFEAIGPGEIRGQDISGQHSFPISKVLVIPNTNIKNEVEKSGKTRVSYFGDILL